MSNRQTNDEIILNGILKDSKEKQAPEMNESDYFELFSAEQVLKSNDLNYDELSSGLLETGGGDGGIDSIYFFINGELIVEDIEDYSRWKKNLKIEVVIIQSKTSSNFTEASITKLINTTKDLFTLETDFESDEVQQKYNSDLLEIVSRFRNTYQELAAKFPSLIFSYFYVSKGNEIHPNVKTRVPSLESTIEELFSDSKFYFSFLGAKDLLDLARNQPSRTYELKAQETPMTIQGNDYVAICRLGDFYSFITDEHGKIRRQIFEANVRDYQGEVSVNKDIKETLNSKTDEDFWWLNNGITILASQVSTKGGKILIVEEPEIVNGLQTSNEIHSHFSSLAEGQTEEARAVLVRVIVPQQKESRDRIIKATNSQTSIPKASLRSTDRIHRNIEDYLSAKGLFYDRRKNFYKNQNKPRSKIVSVQQMAQSLMTVVLGRPDTARARPSTLLTDDSQYEEIFSEKHSIELYFAAIDSLRKVDDYLKENVDLNSREKTNIRFYVMYVLLIILIENLNPSIKEIIESQKKINQDVLNEAFNLVYEVYQDLGGDDKVSKGPSLLLRLNDLLDGSAKKSDAA